MLLLGAVLWYWARHNGGRAPVPLRNVALLALASVPLALSAVRRLPMTARIIALSWGSGGLIAMAFAAERSTASMVVIIYGLVPIVGLVAYRLTRRPWGMAAILGILLLGFGRYWYDGFLAWWGHILMESPAPWTALSWHNATGMLLGAFGLFFSGLALAGRRYVAVAGAILAPAAFAGLWLSSSRGSAVATAIGIAATCVVAAKFRGPIRALLGATYLVIAAAVLVVGLMGFGGGYAGTDPLTDRGEPAGANFAQRLLHMEAAWDMFLDRPLVGHGPGTYRNVAIYYTEPQARLTSHAHNQAAEALGEGGLVFGVPFLLFMVGAAALAGREVVGRSQRATYEVEAAFQRGDDLRVPMLVGAVGAVTALGIHALFDFDWAYPVLPSLFVVGVAIIASNDRVLRSPHAERPPKGVFAVATVLPIALLAVAGTLALQLEMADGNPRSGLNAEELATASVPWDAPRLSRAALDLSESGEHRWASVAVSRASRWNPGYHALQIVEAIVAYRAGNLDSDGLVASLDRVRTQFSDHNRVAAALIGEGELQVAEEILDEVSERYPRYARWGLGVAAETWRLRMRIAFEQDGCDEVALVLRRAQADPLLEQFVDADSVLEGIYDDLCPPD